MRPIPAAIESRSCRAARPALLRCDRSIPTASGRPSAVSPSALALAPDGKTLYVAAGNLNAILVVDTFTGVTLGAIPAGWLPTALAVVDSGKTLLVANYRGEGTRPNHAPLPGIPD